MPASLQQEWLKTTLGVEFTKRLPNLFPKNSNVSIRTLNELSLKELSIYESNDVKETATKILEYLDKILGFGMRCSTVEISVNPLLSVLGEYAIKSNDTALGSSARAI
jgi:hypothetical protein